VSDPPDNPHLPREDTPGGSGGGDVSGAGGAAEGPGAGGTGGDRPVAQRGDPDATPAAPRRTLADTDPWRPPSGARRDPRQTGEMPFMKHLEELRIVLVHCAIGAVAGTIAGWLFAPYVLRDLIARTVHTAIVLAPIEAFNERFRMSLIIGVLVAGPYIFYRVWLFIVPGLLKRERAMVIPLAVLSLALFLAGVAAAYFYIVPLVIQVLSGFLVTGMQAQFRVADVLSFFYNVALACGVICQLPLVTMGLTALGIVTPRFLLKQWRYAIVGAFIITAAITPGDVVTAQIILGFPMAALYFLSVGLSFFVARNKREGETPADVTVEEADRV
jgi:sec-independent protein translocase protein TatC